MALIKCTECKQDISDKALSCPHCGNPTNGALAPSVEIATNPNQPIQVEPVLTSKGWKQVKIIAWTITISGFIIPAFIPGQPRELGWAIVTFGVILLIIGKIGAWYADRRTR
ncbi:MAG: hypothetical protein Q7S84_00415 [bacterium]|nr:hypothetical protein [bacterium]